MELFVLLRRYLRWHYSGALLAIFTLGRDAALLFTKHFAFGATVPWWRGGLSRPGAAADRARSLGEFILSLISGSVFRLILIILRLFFLGVAALVLCLSFLAVPLILLLWLALPLGVLGFYFLGVYLLFSLT